MLPIILASKSPRRQQLLRQINLSFTVQSADIDETLPPSTPPDKAVEVLSFNKAMVIAQKGDNGLYIGSDTIVYHDGEMLGKPDNEAHAYALLHRLSGQTHYVFTGVALVLKQDSVIRHVTFHEVTAVTFAKLTDHDIHEYIATGSPMDKAGAYGIQDDWGSVFVKKIHGDYYTVVGFPLHRFYTELRSFAPEYLPHATA